MTDNVAANTRRRMVAADRIVHARALLVQASKMIDEACRSLAPVTRVSREYFDMCTVSRQLRELQCSLDEIQHGSPPSFTDGAKAPSPDDAEEWARKRTNAETYL